MARADIKLLTIKRLYGLSGNQCAFPGCEVSFVSPEDETNVSNICHIEAAEEGGERYNPNSTDEERRSFENLILLCAKHHTETNDVGKYTVDVLQKMKQEHEAKMLQLYPLSKNPSALKTVISYIGSKLFNDEDVQEPRYAPPPKEKILYNNVIRYKPIIEEYVAYQGWLNEIYKEIEILGSTKKDFVLKNIKSIYLKEKGNYNNIDEIRANADNIIEKVKNELWNIIENSSNTNVDMPIEAIQISLLIILVDAFMRCDILEEPPKP